MSSKSLNRNQQIINSEIKAEALRLGFFACGIAKAEPVDEATAYDFRQWISEGGNARMTYMSNHIEKRLNPQLLMPTAKSIVSVALNYTPANRIAASEYQIAAYAYGQDYHYLMKEKLRRLAHYIYNWKLQLELGTQDSYHTSAEEGINWRVFCDSAPVLERYWAVRAGLGWIGKNHQLIIPHAGSMFFLGEIFLDIDLEYDTPIDNHCGNCHACIKACPTHALSLASPNLTPLPYTPYRKTFHTERCLSYQTIENREELSDLAKREIGNFIYGCDRCQQACPWNRFATPTTEPGLQPKEELLNMTKQQWDTLSKTDYHRLFKDSAIKRAKYNGLMRNIHAAGKKN